jgi:hypothetical protein
MPVTVLVGGLLLVWGTSCNSGGDPDQPDTPAAASNIKVAAVIQRFDQDFFSLDTAGFQAALPALMAKYPVFLPFFTENIAMDPTIKDKSPEAALYEFATVPQLRKLYDSCQVAFPTMEPFRKELIPLLQYFKYYFPERQELTTITAVTEFIGDAYMLNDTTMMIGLDFFLGENFMGYNPELFPQYMRRQFVKENMIVKYGFALSNNLVAPPATEHILDHMIRNGKVLYILDCLLPTVPDSVKMNYTADEFTASINNEQEVWTRLLEMKVLFESLNPKNMKIVTAGPSTDNVFQEAPGQIGNWIGWQIVKTYMKRFPETTLKDLSQQDDAQVFLEKAKYKPKKK